MPLTTGRWTDELSEADSLRVLEDLGLYHANQGGLHGWAIACMIESHDYVGLCSYVLPQDAEGWDVLQLMHCRQALAYFTKYEPLPLGVNKEAAAVETYEASEILCAETNAFFRALAGGSISPLPSLACALYSARAKIARILGRAPAPSELDLRFGPGSTTTITKTRATWQAKLAEAPTCSDELLRSYVFPAFIRELPHWLNEHAVSTRVDEEGYEVAVLDVTVECGRLQFVPKNAKTYRSIDVQPTLNTLLQGGIGRYMRTCLARVGITLRDQSVNQRLARIGSMDNSLCTLDLSSASDTVALGLVRFLLPDDWFALLRAASCGTTMYRGAVRRLEKFSSMGNGFTFPLETLIFWALTASVCEDEVQSVSAFGDDIICPRSRVAAVTQVLQQCGFVINTKKSYTDGPFRESCGADYYRGINVRPSFYADKRLTGESLFLIHNCYVRNLQPEQAKVVEGWIQEPLRIYGPDGYGDGHLLSSEWLSQSCRSYRRRGFGGASFSTYRHLGCFVPSVYPGDYVTPLYAIYCTESDDNLGPDSLSWDWSETSVTGHVQRDWNHWASRTATVDWAKRISPPNVDFIVYEWNREDQFHSFRRPCWSRPGTRGYEKALIYTFAR